MGESNFKQDPDFWFKILARSRNVGSNLEQILDFWGSFLRETYIIRSIFGNSQENANFVDQSFKFLSEA